MAAIYFDTLAHMTHGHWSDRETLLVTSLSVTVTKEVEFTVTVTTKDT